MHLHWLLMGVLWQASQNPSPMTESTRRHERVQKQTIEAVRTGRFARIGNPAPNSPVVIHFHGPAWLAESAAAEAFKDVRVAAIQLGAGSSVYKKAFADSNAFRDLMREVGESPGPVYLSGFSAGYGAIREILRHSPFSVEGVLLLDGLHSGYLDTKSKTVDPADLKPFAAFARQAAAGKKKFLITHSEIFPGTFASTTECTDWLLHELNLKRQPVLEWGPVGMQQLSEAHSGKLLILGFAGNSAPDHVDHIHSMAHWLRRLNKL